MKNNTQDRSNPILVLGILLVIYLIPFAVMLALMNEQFYAYQLWMERIHYSFFDLVRESSNFVPKLIVGLMGASAFLMLVSVTLGLFVKKSEKIRSTAIVFSLISAIIPLVISGLMLIINGVNIEEISNSSPSAYYSEIFDAVWIPMILLPLVSLVSGAVATSYIGE